MDAVDDRDEANTQVEHDVERHVLGLTVRLSDGSVGTIYRRSDRRFDSGVFAYDCRLCGVPNLVGERCLHMHIAGKKHQAKLAQPFIDAIAFRSPMQRNRPQICMKIAPGEPVPPGFENEVKVVSALQATLDACKAQALVGVEYVMELTNEELKEPSYHCVMCDKRADPRTIMFHMTSYSHRLKFLEKHFPTVVKEFQPYRLIKDREIMMRIMQNVCEAIEETHGRLSPSVYDYHEYEKTKMRVLQLINCDKHIDEKMGSTFVHIIDHKAIQCAIDGDLSAIGINLNSKRGAAALVASASNKSTDLAIKTSDDDGGNSAAAAPKKLRRESRMERNSLDSISSLSDASITSDRESKSGSSHSKVIDLRSTSRSLSPVADGLDKNAKQIMPTPKQLSQQSAEIAKERYSWEKYRCQLELALPKLQAKLADHEANPEKHPLYPDEWKKFWNRRYKELQAEKKDPSKHDFKPEWIVFWMGRMKELHASEIEAKKKELRKALNLPEEGFERNVKQQYALKIHLKTTSLDNATKTASSSSATTKSTSSTSSSSTKRTRKAANDTSTAVAAASSSSSRSRPSQSQRSRRSRSRSPAVRRARRSRSRSPLPARRTRRSRSRSLRRHTRSRSRSPHQRSATSTKRPGLLRRPSVDRRLAFSPLSDVEMLDDVVGAAQPMRSSAPNVMQPYPTVSPAYYAQPQMAVDEWGRPIYYASQSQLTHAAYAPPPYFRDATAAPVFNQKLRPVVKNTVGIAAAAAAASAKQEAEQEPVTVVSVLRLLTALEELLGSLGPKVIDLLAKALALEKVKPNSADDMLVNEDTCVLFETIKEKLKGQLIADVVERHKIPAVKRAVKNVALIIHLVNEKTKKEAKEKAAAPEPATAPVTAVPLVSPTSASVAATVSSTAVSAERAEIAAKIARALTLQGKTDVTAEQLTELINVYEAMHQAKKNNANVTAAEFYNASASGASAAAAATAAAATTTQTPVPVAVHIPASSNSASDSAAANALESLTDSDLQTLLQNFGGLSGEEQRHLIAYLKKLEITQPRRVETLRKFVNVDALSRDADEIEQVEPPEKIMYPSKAVLQKTAAARAAAAAAAAAATNQSSDGNRGPNRGGGGGASQHIVETDEDDDDDYSYDDVFKAASQKVQEKQLAEQRRDEEERQRKREEEFAQAGRRRNDSNGKGSSGGSSGSGGGSTLTLADTQNMIANLMGSLQKNVQNKGIRAQTQQQQQQQQQASNGGGALSKDQQPAVILDELDIEPLVNHNQNRPNTSNQRNSNNTAATATTAASASLSNNVPYYQQHQHQQHYYEVGHNKSAYQAAMPHVAYPAQPPPPPPEQQPPPPPPPQQPPPVAAVSTAATASSAAAIVGTQQASVQYPYAHAASAAAVQYPGYTQQQTHQQQQQAAQQQSTAAYGQQNAAYAYQQQYQQQQQQYQQHYQQMWQQQQQQQQPRTTGFPNNNMPARPALQQQQQQTQQPPQMAGSINPYRMSNPTGGYVGGNNNQTGYF